MIFKTQTAKYVIENNTVTRFSETPIKSHHGVESLFMTTLEQIPDPVVGQRCLILTSKGPVHTTYVTEVIDEPFSVG